MSNLTEQIVVVLMGIIGVAMLAALVSNKSNTEGVIHAGASGFGNSLAVALSPVTGSSYSIDLSYPTDHRNSFGT